MAEKAGVPSGMLALRAELQGSRAKKIGSVPFGDLCAVLLLGADSLWAVVENDAGPRVALRCFWAPGDEFRVEFSSPGEIAVRSALGLHRVQIVAPTPKAPILRVTATLTPDHDVTIPWWPRDLYPLELDLDLGGEPGEVLAAQRGLNTGLLYGQFRDPGDGTFFYLQDLTSLNAYFQRAGTTPDGIVGGDWPELGTCLPAVSETPLRAGEEITLTDAYLRLDPTRPEDCRVEARLFLEHLAAIYPYLQKPDPQFRDWPAKSEETLRDLAESSIATVRDAEYRYVRPYVNAEEPDSMVQLALLNVIREYGDWKGEMSPLADELREGVYRFFDPEIGAVRRYLSTVGPDKPIDEVDSWYLCHPLQSLARLAKEGDQGARDMFFASLEFAIKAAHTFDYKWPVKFAMSSLDIVTALREPGGYGQTDAGGLYAYVMLDAYEITKEERYLEEAKKAIQATASLEFDLTYQTNLTSWGASACLRLWQATEDRFYLDHSYVFFASFLHNCVIWNSDIGKVAEPDTFFAVSCLHNGPYFAPFECYESVCAFHECLELAEGDLPVSVRMLLTEFIRYGLDRAWWFYPSSLRECDLAHSPRNGAIVRKLAFPLEDLYVAGDPAGQVGQEVYGAGMALALSTRFFHLLEGGRMLFCAYPLREFDGKTFTVRGAPGSVCEAQILPPKGATVKVDGEKVEAERFRVPVGAKVEMRFRA